MKVLFVCRANAARGQEAEAFYNALTGTHDASSAGVDLLNSVKGSDPSLPDVVIQVMGEVGIDVSARRRKELTEQMVADADVVISMVADFPLPPYLASSPKLVVWTDLPDPVRQPIEVHRQVRDVVRKKVEEFVKSM